MKRIKVLMLLSLLSVLPTVALAEDLVADADPARDDFGAVVPEPSSALVMGVALTTVALVARRKRE